MRASPSAVERGFPVVVTYGERVFGCRLGGCSKVGHQHSDPSTGSKGIPPKQAVFINENTAYPLRISPSRAEDLCSSAEDPHVK